MNTLKKRKIILNEKMYKVILLLAMPIMFNNIIQMLYNLTDTYFLSKLGATEVASMTLVWPVIFMQLAIGTGIGVAGTTLIAQNIGANNLKDARKVGGQILTFTIFFSILLAVIGFLGAPYLIRMMGAKGLIYTNGLSYLILSYLYRSRSTINVYQFCIYSYKTR